MKINKNKPYLYNDVPGHKAESLCGGFYCNEFLV